MNSQGTDGNVYALKGESKMNWFMAVILFLTGGVSVILLEVLAVESFLDDIRAFFQSFLG